MTKTSESRRCVITIAIKEVRSLSLIGFPLVVLIRYNAVLEACGLLQDLAELPYGEMTEVSVSVLISPHLYHVLIFYFSSGTPAEEPSEL